MKKFIFPCKIGNALTEYSLIGILLVVVSIGSLSMLGYAVSNVFKNMLNTNPNAIVQQQAHMAQLTNSAVTTANNVTSVTGQAGASNASILVQTSGANGGTDTVTTNTSTLIQDQQSNQALSSGGATIGAP